ncbi:MAG: hypothetical protein ACE5RH_02670 [Nitrosarchaeum sp.]
MKETNTIKYSKGYKYMLEEEAYIYTGIILKDDFITKRVIHFKNGWLLIKDGFGWDGASGIAYDDHTNMRASLMHDGMYYLLRHGFPMKYRIISDEMLKQLMITDGAIPIRAKYYKWAVSHFGKGSADPQNQRKIIKAP